MARAVGEVLSDSGCVCKDASSCGVFGDDPVPRCFVDPSHCSRGGCVCQDVGRRGEGGVWDYCGGSGEIERVGGALESLSGGGLGGDDLRRRQKRKRRLREVGEGERVLFRCDTDSLNLPQRDTAWTFLLYMNADNDLELNGVWDLSMELLRLERSGDVRERNLNLVVLVDRHSPSNSSLEEVEASSSPSSSRLVSVGVVNGCPQSSLTGEEEVVEFRWRMRGDALPSSSPSSSRQAPAYSPPHSHPTSTDSNSADADESPSRSTGDFTGAFELLLVWSEQRERLEWVLLKDHGEVNMGSPSLLADFVKRGVDTFGATHYGLTFWSHGAGWVGLGKDQSHPEEGGMRLSAVRSGIEAGLWGSERSREQETGGGGKLRLSFLGMDACLMGSLSVVDTLSPFAEYILASEANEPSSGWNWRVLAATDGEGGTLSPLQLGTRMWEGYTITGRNAAWVEMGNPLTLSLVKTSAFLDFRDRLDEALKTLFRCGSSEVSAVVREALRQTARVEGCSACTCGDLGEFLELLSNETRITLRGDVRSDSGLGGAVRGDFFNVTSALIEQIEVTRDAFRDALTLHHSEGAHGRHTGLSFFIPLEADDSNRVCTNPSSSLSRQEEFFEKFDSGISHFLKQVVEDEAGGECWVDAGVAERFGQREKEREERRRNVTASIEEECEDGGDGDEGVGLKGNNGPSVSGCSETMSRRKRERDGETGTGPRRRMAEETEKQWQRLAPPPSSRPPSYFPYSSGGSLLFFRPEWSQGTSFRPQRGGGAFLPQRGQGTVIPQRGQGTVIPQRGQGTVIPQRGQGTVIPQRGQGTVIPQRRGGVFTPQRDGGVVSPRADPIPNETSRTATATNSTSVSLPHREALFSPTCPQGFQLDETSGKCTDVDECANDLLPEESCGAGPEVQCVNFEGAFACACKEGFEVSDRHCVAVPETVGDGDGELVTVRLRLVATLTSMLEEFRFSRQWFTGVFERSLARSVGGRRQDAKVSSLHRLLHSADAENGKFRTEVVMTVGPMETALKLQRQLEEAEESGDGETGSELMQSDFGKFFRLGAEVEIIEPGDDEKEGNGEEQAEGGDPRRSGSGDWSWEKVARHVQETPWWVIALVSFAVFVLIFSICCVCWRRRRKRKLARVGDGGGKKETASSMGETAPFPESSPGRDSQTGPGGWSLPERNPEGGAGDGERELPDEGGRGWLEFASVFPSPSAPPLPLHALSLSALPALSASPLPAPVHLPQAGGEQDRDEGGCLRETQPGGSRRHGVMGVGDEREGIEESAPGGVEPGGFEGNTPCPVLEEPESEGSTEAVQSRGGGMVGVFASSGFMYGNGNRDVVEAGSERSRLGGTRTVEEWGGGGPGGLFQRDNRDRRVEPEGETLDDERGFPLIRQRSLPAFYGL
uniref:EGF-like domain-containing protein n=1 Tax=Chromera velia CCMP2878 TaxID=1169474 RepID=A0A0G4F4Z7_9ALVE|eukprot:Cvel_15101.t1-p1 / transcript=Cvel_15101.t1 / gene=Cvel_15101 / organism=Chromera_velia_CCMP2878 / gene_product=Fibulin-1, putative / transcript_product=Fibulin-1, putative / location=Cvel_scaffold1102:12367-19645(-) / protein_length=1394 / sequence_SO=supercontig / SO=protein_coding / is_pseudo=false